MSNISCNPIPSTIQFVNHHPALFLRSALVISVASIVIGSLGVAGILPMGVIGGSILLTLGAGSLVLIIALRSKAMQDETNNQNEKPISGPMFGWRATQRIDRAQLQNYIVSFETSGCMFQVRRFLYIESSIAFCDCECPKSFNNTDTPQFNRKSKPTDAAYDGT